MYLPGKCQVLRDEVTRQYQMDRLAKLLNYISIKADCNLRLKWESSHGFKGNASSLCPQRRLYRKSSFIHTPFNVIENLLMNNPSKERLENTSPIGWKSRRYGTPSTMKCDGFFLRSMHLQTMPLIWGKEKMKRENLYCLPSTFFQSVYRIISSTYPR